MKIVREALAGTQESSDLMVKIAPRRRRAGDYHPQ
ncbi:citrate lyase subunit gamma [Raoultella planticola]|uniref:Citrate lyase subunit gamma n=1 Tax=Raoultella planticola TaxID=575 RepID=A0A485BRG0_RAOPL|nr:citrate lyase subunit gamma [Raoultella planticola]